MPLITEADTSRDPHLSVSSLALYRYVLIIQYGITTSKYSPSPLHLKKSIELIPSLEMASTDAIPSLMNKQTLHQPSPVQFRRQHRPKLPLSVLTAILVVLGLQFIVLPRYVYQASPSDVKLNQFQLNRLDAKLLECAASRQQPIQYPVTKAGSRSNPRWNPVSGQKETIILRNATLFDGETILSEAVDIVLKKGIVESVTLAGKESLIFDKDTKVLDLEGGYVTPGLVDMHSHHLA